jgi:hypothetical protein
LEELRNTPLELVKKNPQSSGIKFQSSGMGVFSLYTLEDKIQEYFFGVQELNKIHHILKRYALLCPKFIPGLHIQKTRKKII